VIPLGILAAAGGAVAAGSYDLLATEILTSSESSIEFTSLNSTYGADYQHLQIRTVTRDTRSDTGSNILFRVNGVTTSSYAHHRLYADGSTVNSYSGVSTTSIINGVTASANSTANSFGVSVIDILDPFTTDKNTTVRTLSGTMANATGGNLLVLGSGLFNSTASITSFSILPTSGSFVTGSRFSLYGLKASA